MGTVMAVTDATETAALRPENTLTPAAAPSDESRQSALVALGRRAVAASDTLLLMQDAASLVAETLDADFSSVAELLPEGNTFNVRLNSAKGGSPLVYQTGTGEAESLAGYALGIGHPVIIADLVNETLRH